MNELSLFTGAGGGVLGTHLLGWRPVGYVEFNDYCQRVLAARIRDGYIPNAPIFGDIRAFLDEGWAGVYQGMVDVVTAGFPCQPFSAAGKRRGEDDPRNMWPATAEVIRLVEPRWCLLENVPDLLGPHGYFGQVLRDLASMGYDARWGVLGAGQLGCPHFRERVWVLARNTNMHQYEGNEAQQNVLRRTPSKSSRLRWWESEPSVGRVANGMANRLDRAKAIGNGQVPAVVRLAWEMLTQ
jgi:DNA (cytosine-5)-methyltransferase 1